jgi:hypothetical protein
VGKVVLEHFFSEYFGFFPLVNILPTTLHIHIHNNNNNINHYHHHPEMVHVVNITQPLTEMRTRNKKIIISLGSKVRQVRRADNLTAICEPIV